MLLMRKDPSYLYNPHSFKIPTPLHGSPSCWVLGSPSMTMFPVGNAFHGGGSCGLVSRVEAYECCNTATKNNSRSSSKLLSGHHNPSIMAEEESRTTNSLNEAAASSSRDNNNNSDNPEEKHDQGWLQLSIGGNNDNTKGAKLEIDQEKDLSFRERERGLVELDLLPPGVKRPVLQPPMAFPTIPTAAVQHSVMMNMANHTSPYSFFQVNPAAPPYSHSQEIQWAFQSNIFPPNVTSISSLSPPSSSPSSAALMPIGSCFARPIPVQMAGVDLGGSSHSDNIRIVNAPRRPHSGIWFMLQASKSQAREPFLPQIPKSFLRIKDGGMTVRLVIKYLVNKLRLDNETEVEMRCRGQHLFPSLTLQHVRDNIWSPRDTFSSLLPSTDSTMDHLMVLHYARREDSNS